MAGQSDQAALRNPMSDTAPTRRPYQYSLWSLLVLTTLVSVLCSIGVCTDWTVPLVIILGIRVCVVGFGRLSFRKQPEAGCAFMIGVCLVRLTGLGIVAFGLILWLAMARRW